MIRTHEKLRLTDLNKQHDLLIEVNWDAKDSKSNDCQLLRFHYPNGDVATIKRDDFNAILFLIGTPSQQRDLVPQKVETIRNIETTLGIKATKNIAKGEMINVPVKIPIPHDSQIVYKRSR